MILGNIAALFIPVRDGPTRVRTIIETSSNTFRSIWQEVAVAVVAVVAVVVEDVLEVGLEVVEVRFQEGVE